MVADSRKNVSSCALLVIAIVVSKALITASTTAASDTTTALTMTTASGMTTATGFSESPLPSTTMSASSDGETATSISVTTGTPITAMTTSATNMMASTDSISIMSSSSPSMSTTPSNTDLETTGSDNSSVTTEISTINTTTTNMTTSITDSTSPTSSSSSTNWTTELSTTKLATEPPTEPRTDPRRPTEPPTEAKVGPVPEPTFPELGEDAVKTYRFEFAVNENSTEECMSSNLSSPACEIFKDAITLELEDLYGENEAFQTVEVKLRRGSVIVSHNVTYSYNKMTEEQKMASAQDIYDQTLGEAVADGKLGNYTVDPCDNCSLPQETSNICDLDFECLSDYAKAICGDNYWVCESVCDTAYCNGNGICWQRDDLYTQPICSCDWDNDHWYWGYNCQYYVDQMYLIIGCSCGGAVLIVLLVSLFAYAFVKNNYKSHKKKSSLSDNDEDVINAFQNLGYDHSETVFPPIDDMDDGDILQRRRPYSYIYTKGEDLTNMESGSSFTKTQNGSANQRDSRLEVNEDAAKRLSNLSNGSSDIRHSSFLRSNGGPQERNSEFWGNLNDQPTEHIKLEPVLDHIDVNESYKIQRPMISPNYSYANTSATPNVYQSIDSPQSQHLPDPDYAQR